MTIDVLTLGSNSLLILKELDFNGARFYAKGTMHISYISNKQLKKLQALYFDAYGLKSIALLDKRKIDIDDKEFDDFIVNVFIPVVRNFKFVQYFEEEKQEEFFDEREKEEYQKYMDNLPDSFDVHSKQLNNVKL